MSKYAKWSGFELDQDIRENAIKWSAFIKAGGQRHREDFPSLLEAATCAQQYEAACAKNGLPEKRALVYAIDANGNAALVPDAEWRATL